MHIVFLTNEFPFKNQSHGGIGTFVEYLSSKLVKNNIDVSVVGVTKHNTFSKITAHGVHLYNIKQSSSKAAKFVFNSLRIRNTLKKIHSTMAIDIVEGSELSFAFLPRKTPYKKVIRMHGGHHFFAIELGKKPAVWRSFQEKQSFKKADALIAVSAYVGAKTKELLQFELPYTTIFNFINLDFFKPQNGIEIIPNTIFFVGTVCKKKGVKELVESFIKVKKEIKNASLHIIGRDWLDEEVGSYTAHVKEFISSEIEDSIKFYGTVSYDDLPKLLSSAQVCVYPSHSESFGLTLIEAMAMEKAIIASEIMPFKEIMDHNETGILVNPFNTDEMANQIINLLSDTQKAAEFSNSARARVLKKFNSDDLLIQNIDFYKSLA